MHGSRKAQNAVLLDEIGNKLERVKENLGSRATVEIDKGRCNNARYPLNDVRFWLAIELA